jgi:hypothetical protein
MSMGRSGRLLALVGWLGVAAQVVAQEVVKDGSRIGGGWDGVCDAGGAGDDRR